MASLTSEEEWRNALVTLSQFVFLGDKDYLRKDLHKNAIEIALFLNKEKEPISYVGIQEIFQKELWNINLPLKIIETNARALSDEGKVLLSREKISLSIQRREKIQAEVQKAQERKAEIEKIFVDILVEQYRLIADQPLYGKDQTLCTDLFWKSISKLISFKANTVAQLLSSSRIGMDVSMSNALFNNIHKEILDKKLGKSFKTSFEVLFQRKIGTFLQFLFDCSQVLTCWKILSLDPSADKLKNTEFEKKTLIVDTNTLMGLLCSSNYNHKSTEEVINLSQQIGVKIRITSKTVAEFKHVLNLSHERYPLLGKVSNRILGRINDDFISSYALETETESSLTWQQYYEKMSNLEDTLKKFNIEVVNVDNVQLVDEKNFRKVTDEVIRVWAKYRYGKKEADVAEHDAFHLLLIKELREKDNRKSTLGPNYWFLTRDSTLGQVNQLINSLEIFKSHLSSSIKESVWVDFITPFLNSQTRKEEIYVVFADLLRSEFMTIPKGISSRTLIEIQGEWTKYEWLSTEAIEDILKDTVMQTLASKLAKLDPDDDESKEVVKEMRQHFDTLLSQKFNERMGSFQEEMTTLHEKYNAMNYELQTKTQEVSDLKSEVNHLKTDKKTDARFRAFWRTVSGILGSILVID